MRRAFAFVAALLSVGVCGVASCQPSETAQDSVSIPPSAPAWEPKEGDSVVFIGDSITQKALFTQYLETFFLTRYPDREIKFRNAGVDGERAANVLERFDADVMVEHPTHGLILLGMNDAGYSAWKSDLFATFRSDLTTLLDRLDAAGVKVSLLSPTLFDSRVSRLAEEPGKEPGVSLYNGALAYYGEWCREIAIQRGLGFADLQAPLARITSQQRRTDPRFTLVPDAVHPDANGGLVMAVTILDEIFADPGPVSAIDITVRPGDSPMGEATNGTLTLPKEPADGNALDFDFVARSLPWVVPEAAQLGFRMTDAGQRFNSETLRIRNLPPGRYTMSIGDVEIGQWTDGELAAGIDLQGNTNTPQYQRSLEITNANAERSAGDLQAYRNWWAEKRFRENEIAQAASAEPVDVAATAKLREDYQTWLNEKFLKEMPEAQRRVLETEKTLRERARKPVTQSYQLRRLP